MVAVLFIAIAAYIVYAMASPKSSKSDERCTELVINIQGADDAPFLTSKRIEDELHQGGVYPKGQYLKDVSVRKIIDTMKKDQFIAAINCYKTANCKVVIDVTQRTPVLYILPDNKQGYYVDADGGIIRNTDYPANLPVATGNIDQQFATKCLCYIGAYIVEDEFLNSQIEQIYVKKEPGKQPDIDLVPRVGQQQIHMGSIENYAKKLERLKTFYKDGLTSVGWNKYSHIDLEYDNQVICKKTK